MSEIERIQEQGMGAVDKLRRSQAAAEGATEPLSQARALSEGLLQQAVDDSKEHGDKLYESLASAVDHLAGLLAGMRQVRSQTWNVRTFVGRGNKAITTASLEANQANLDLEDILPEGERLAYTRDVITRAYAAEHDTATARSNLSSIADRARTGANLLAPLAEVLREAMQNVQHVNTMIDRRNGAKLFIVESTIANAELGAREAAEAAQVGADQLEQRIAGL